MLTKSAAPETIEANAYRCKTNEHIMIGLNGNIQRAVLKCGIKNPLTGGGEK